MTDLEKFARELIQASWKGCDGGDLIQEAAIKHHLVKQVPFDPAIHSSDCDAEEGDVWLVFDGPLAKVKAEART